MVKLQGNTAVPQQQSGQLKETPAVCAAGKVSLDLWRDPRKRENGKFFFCRYLKSAWTFLRRPTLARCDFLTIRRILSYTLLANMVTTSRPRVLMKYSVAICLVWAFTNGFASTSNLQLYRDGRCGYLGIKSYPAVILRPSGS